MATVTTSTYGTEGAALFNPELTTELFDKVKGASSLAKLSGAEPIPFSGLDVFTFSMDGEAAIVGACDLIEAAALAQWGVAGMKEKKKQVMCL